MKSAVMIVGALVLSAGLVAGCGPQDTATEGAPQRVAGGELGTEREAGPFIVTMSIEEPLQVGDRNMVVFVAHDGMPVTDGNVVVDLSMPDMQMLGPDVTMTHLADGRYEGTANLSMGGPWQAIVRVSAHDETGEAAYHFDVPEGEGGMAH
jgi:nitrogen fixation protein FixH